MKEPIAKRIHHDAETQLSDQLDDDDLVNDLLASNAKFQEMALKSKASPRKPFVPRGDK